MSSDTSDAGYWQVASTAIPAISSVRLYSDALDHIYAGHPEVETVGREGILRVVEDPSKVYANSKDRRGYVYSSSTVRFQDNDLHVIVTPVEGTSGRISTALFIGRPYSSQVLWERDDDT